VGLLFQGVPGGLFVRRAVTLGLPSEVAAVPRSWGVPPVLRPRSCAVFALFTAASWWEAV